MIWAILLIAYYVTPFGGAGAGGEILRLVIGIALVVLVLARQIRQIVAAEHPGLQAVQGLAVIFRFS